MLCMCVFVFVCICSHPIVSHAILAAERFRLYVYVCCVCVCVCVCHAMYVYYIHTHKYIMYASYTHTYTHTPLGRTRRARTQEWHRRSLQVRAFTLLGVFCFVTRSLLTPAILAGEGFHFCPTAQDPDTVICFFCDLQVSRVCTYVSPGISCVLMYLRVSPVCSYVSSGISCVHVCVDQCLLWRHFTRSLLLRD
jgi:hypothetical protein